MGCVEELSNDDTSEFISVKIYLDKYFRVLSRLDEHFFTYLKVILDKKKKIIVFLLIMIFTAMK